MFFSNTLVLLSGLAGFATANLAGKYDGAFRFDMYLDQENGPYNCGTYNSTTPLTPDGYCYPLAHATSVKLTDLHEGCKGKLYPYQDQQYNILIIIML
jgi:hypothetical protein